MMLGKLDSHMQKKLYNYLYYTHKLTQSGIKVLNIKPEVIRFIKENISSKLFDISLSKAFVDITPMMRETKAKNNQMGLHQTKKLLPSKGNHL